MSEHTIYYEKLAAAFVRCKLHNHAVRETYSSLFATALEELSEHEQHELIELGLQQGLRLHRFKRTMDLPRVRKVIGILRGIQPATLLDIGGDARTGGSGGERARTSAYAPTSIVYMERNQYHQSHAPATH